MTRTIILVACALSMVGYAATRLDHVCTRYEVVAVAPHLDPFLASHGFADPYVRSEPNCVAYSNWYFK